MSLPSFPGGGGSTSPPATAPPTDPGAGAGDHLPARLLELCAACTLVATGLSIMSIVLQLKNYRMPALQRCVVRIMVMVPLYACSSLIALYSLNAAFWVDAIRDLYEAFVIYAFLQLLITYLGGERELLLRLRGRPLIPHLFPVNIFLSPMDPSDPWTLLNLKRGVLQYVQVKPLLVVATAISKWTGTYHEGDFAVTSGYTWVTAAYNISICLSLYCLGMFWVAVNNDLKPFRPVPKFLCVKGILFFSFWQSVGISFLVSIGIITKVGPYTDPEHMSLALVDSLICIEMPFFAIAHQYAFQASDYIDPNITYAARLPFYYACRDAFGVKDVWEDIKYTFRARGLSYKAYETADGGLHHEEGRRKRIRAGMRYAHGGQAKYWISVPGASSAGERGALLPNHNGHVGQYGPPSPIGADPYDSSDDSDSDTTSVDFSSMSEGEDAMYARARRIGYSGFPNVDVSREKEQRRRREEEDGILAGRQWRRSVVEDLGDGDDGDTPVRQPERRSVRNQRAGLGKGKKDKGKGKDTNNSKGRMGVYGAWADRVTSVDGPVVATVIDAPFDGENENPGAWHASEDEGATALKWTSKRLGAPRPPVADKPFVLEDDKPASPPAPEPIRKDAVDLFSHAPALDSAPRSRTNSARNSEAARSRANSNRNDKGKSTTPPQRLVPDVLMPAGHRRPSPLPSPLSSSPSTPISPAPPPPPPPPAPVDAATPSFSAAPPRDASPPRAFAPSSFRVPSYARWAPPDDDNPWA